MTAASAPSRPPRACRAERSEPASEAVNGRIYIIGGGLNPEGDAQSTVYYTGAA